VRRPPSEPLPLTVWEAPTVRLGSAPAPATVTLAGGGIDALQRLLDRQVLAEALADQRCSGAVSR
jgi:hypothetical protein